MLKALSSIFLFLSVSSVQASQVVISCDFKGFQGVDDVQVMDTPAGMKVNVFMVNENFKFYSLPKAESRWGAEVDLGGFNIFNELSHPRIYNDQGRWYFLADKVSQRLDCATFNY